MYSDKKSILQLAALLQAHHITDIVLCPGSRNAPIVHTLAQIPAFHCYQETDERNAGFLAIGLAQATGRPTAVCCTSGSALLNLHPAVAEAFYQQVPLIVISADRPAAWIGQQDGQTLPQPGAFGSLVKCAVNLPEVRTDEDEWYCNRLINEAILKTQIGNQGPTHINIPLSEPLYQFTETELPVPRVIRYAEYRDFRPSGNGDISIPDHLKADTNRTLLVLGQLPPRTAIPAARISDEYHYIVRLAEHLSNCGNTDGYIKNFDAILHSCNNKTVHGLRPTLLITCGGHIVSARLKKFLRNNPPVSHWHVSAEGTITDTFGCLTAVIRMEPETFLNEVLPVIDRTDSKAPATEYYYRWHLLSGLMFLPPYSSFSAPVAVGNVLSCLPRRCVLHLGNSSVVRYAQLYTFSRKSEVEVTCNRGVNGIEGSLPAAVGYALATDCPNIVILGDLTFFYGMNALARQDIPANLRILLLNNFGGGIFQTIKGMPHGDTARFIVGEQRLDARQWAEARGFRYFRVTQKEEWRDAFQCLIKDKSQDQPVFVEVFTNAEKDAKVYEDYFSSLMNTRADFNPHEIF